MQSIIPLTKRIEVTPTVSTSPAYTAEDQVGGIQTLTSICSSKGRSVNLMSIVIHDKAKQSAALSIFFFDELPTVVSVDNGAIDISDAEMADKCLGVVSVAAASYVNVAGSSVVTLLPGSAGLQLTSQDALLNGNLYVVVKTTGTPTYASTTDLIFKYEFSQN